MVIARHSRRKTQDASALLICLLLIVVTLPLIVSYTTASQRQLYTVNRSQTWNASLPAAEAGIEEAFAHLNTDCYSNGINQGNTNWINGWGTTTNGFAAPLRLFGSNYYLVRMVTNSAISGATPNSPDIVSIGFSPNYLSGSPDNVPSWNWSSTKSRYIARQIRVKTLNFYLFSFGLFSLNGISANGQFWMDSFDSTSTNSYYGKYDRRYILLSNAPIGALHGNIDLGSQGKVVGPGFTSPTGGVTNGSIGDLSWVSTNSGTEPGFYRNDLNIPVQDVVLPSRDWLTLLQCNCIRSYTNPVVTNATITSGTYPNPVPAGGVITNSSGIITTTNYPSPVPSGGVTTNLATYTSTTVPNPIPANFSTNNGSKWWTNWAPNITSAPTYPTAFAASPGVITGVLVTNQYLTAPPPASCYSSYWDYVYKKQGGGNAIDRQKFNSEWYTNYVWDWKQYYAYRTTESYNWWTLSYSYVTNSYVYTGAVTNQEVVTSTFKYVVGTGSYDIDSLSMSGNDKMLVNGNAVIYVRNSTALSGQAQIIIAPGANLTFYFGGDVKLAGQGFVNNNNTASTLQMYGLSTCTSIAISGNASITGTIFAPEADISANGGGNNRYDIVGAVMGKSISMNGHFEVHYDVSLAKNGPSTGFLATKWAEEVVGTGP